MRVAPRRIVGRDVELATIREFLAAVRTEPSALLLEGEPGIGKTALWAAGVSEAHRMGHRVLSCRAAQAEAKLPYTALTDLLAEAADEVSRLSPPHSGGPSKSRC